jgi:hypothetical protein
MIPLCCETLAIKVAAAVMNERSTGQHQPVLRRGRNAETVMFRENDNAI